MPAPLDQLRQLVDGTRPPPPIATLIGFTLSAVALGEAVIEFAAGRQQVNPMGTLLRVCCATSPMRPWAWRTPRRSAT